jgi:hypothetical protein
MKLDPDCIRDILLTVEEHVGFAQYLDYPVEPPGKYKRLAKYPLETVLYHIQQCELAGLVTKVYWYLGMTCSVDVLSPKGHEFLADIRNDTNWAKTKTIAAEVGSFSLDALKSIASSVISDLIRKSLGH